MSSLVEILFFGFSYELVVVHLKGPFGNDSFIFRARFGYNQERSLSKKQVREAARCAH